VGIIPTSTEDPDGALKEWKEDLDKAGLTMVPLDVRRREDSSSPVMLAAAKRCTGFWFSGGDQNRVGDKIVGTPLQKLILERYAEGAGIGGTSAGAAIMSRIMLTGDDRDGKEALTEIGKGAYRTREGMGFLPPHCIVDQHFLRRNRQNRLFSVMMEHPDHLGLGIDEATALVVKGGRATVLGELGYGASLGEMALVDDGPTSARVEAVSEVVAYGWPLERLRRHLATNEGTALRLLKVISRTLSVRLRETNRIAASRAG